MYFAYKYLLRRTCWNPYLNLQEWRERTTWELILWKHKQLALSSLHVNSMNNRKKWRLLKQQSLIIFIVESVIIIFSGIGMFASGYEQCELVKAYREWNSCKMSATLISHGESDTNRCTHIIYQCTTKLFNRVGFLAVCILRYYILS